VAFYSYGALGTDRYPPFSLGEEPGYPATLDIAYPERLSRGRVLVKWWLLAIPHYLILGLLLGGGWAGSGMGDWHWGWGWVFSTGLIGLLVLFAGVALLFTTRYPRGLFDLVLGFDRWVARVVAYVGLMTDAYPPFRLDQGGADTPATPPETPLAPTAALAEEPPAPAAAPPPRSGAARVVLLVVGTIAALLALVTLVGGCALVAVDQTQRDDDGFVMSPTDDFRTATYAIVSESAELDTEGAEWALDTFLGTVRIRSESDRAVFVGIAAAADVDAYLDGVEHDVVTDLDREPSYSRVSGGAPVSPPGEQTFWAASATGVGEQTLEWDPEDGDWRVVVMNNDAARGVSAELAIGAELDAILWIGIGLLVVGALLAAAAALAITVGARRRAGRI
jgi:hypothetical protein